MSKDELPLVSIAIPTYNRADRYLRNVIMSAVSQTYDNVEVIVSDNGSTDNTEEVVRSIESPRIRYYKQPQNIGAVPNSNFCLEKSKGAYFLLLHDDDLIDNDYVETCMKAVNCDTNYGVVLSGTRVINEDGVVLNENINRVEDYSNEDFFLAWFNHKVPIYLCSTLFNSRGLKELGGFRSPNDLYDDVAALFQLAAKMGRKDIKEVKSSFRRHSQNIGTTRYTAEDWCEDSHFLLEIMCELVEDKKDIIRQEGLYYFSYQNYIRASRASSVWKRIQSYLFVYKSFNYACFPLDFLCADSKMYQLASRAARYCKRSLIREASHAVV